MAVKSGLWISTAEAQGSHRLNLDLEFNLWETGLPAMGRRALPAGRVAGIAEYRALWGRKKPRRHTLAFLSTPRMH